MQAIETYAGRIFPIDVKWAKLKINSFKKAMVLRTLESNLSQIIVKVNGHRKNNVPKHSEVYRVLLAQAELLIDVFCKTYNIADVDVIAQMPAMLELRDWGSPVPPRIPPTLKAIGIVVAAIAGTVLIGFTSGSIQRLYHFGWAIAQHHAH